MPRYRYHTADVFTDQPFGGNQLAVFPDARGIPEHRLLDVTREFNYSETTFVFPADDAAHTRRVRIFTPGGEVPFAGHPTVGTAHVLAATGEIALSGDTTRIVLEEKVGPVPVTIRSRAGMPEFCQLSVAMLPQVGPPPPASDALAAVLGLDVADLLGGAWAPQSLSCGLPFLFIPVRDRAAVARARVRLDAWESTLAGTWAPEIFVFAREGERPGSDLRARMFAPGISVPEDPATGSANAALAGYLAARDPRRDGTLRWRVEQGFEMGRPSILDVEADVAAGDVTAVRVGGASVLVCSGEMEIA
ncbi:MAG: phenazine biosynthesis protein PhzF family [Gemmatimonadetes bacterium]|jgi:trans-2,3-dihydro-3-hydroxyanthranilate isomerase|nr:phenazine biosynthesis protein PhzF family [Gemmatimonadota bacterium]